jgi:hypothetical protein
MREQSIWNDEREEQFKKLVIAVSEAEETLKKGGIKLNDAIKLAKNTRRNRQALQILLSARSVADSNTAEGQAENARFQRLLSLCLVYKNDGKPVYNNLEDLLNEEDETKLKVSAQAFDILGKLIYRLDDQLESKLPENVFLKEWNLIDEKLLYVNDKGELVDELGRRIDEEGRLVNDKGELIDSDGHKITEEGELIIEESKPFLDDDGNPVTPPKR